MRGTLDLYRDRALVGTVVGGGHSGWVRGRAGVGMAPRADGSSRGGTRRTHHRKDRVSQRPCPRCAAYGVTDASHALALCTRPPPTSAASAPWGALEETSPNETPPPDRWSRARAEASALGAGMYGYFLWVDAQCALAGMPSASPWWRWSIGQYYTSEKPWGVFLVGRGGGKSTTLEKVAGSDSFWGARKIPPGQVWTWPFISVGPEDANRRVTGTAAVYRAIGLRVIGEEGIDGKAKDGVKISRAPRGSMELLDAMGNEIQLASIAGTIGNVSGPSTLGMTIDEAAKLRDKSANANPLTEIIASGAQTSRARRGWRAICCSSAWERIGAHFQLVEQGDNETNFVARIGAEFLDAALRGFADVAAWERLCGDMAAERLILEHMAALSPLSPLVPTWVANPTLGNSFGEPWDGAALASRKLVQALPEGALGGIPRTMFWLRENGSVPMNRRGETHPDSMAQTTFGREDILAAW